jgi:glycosyltransferase involved in cell wall biosynthesis
MEAQTMQPSPSNAPLVSVAITSYNSADWLGRAIESVLMQRTAFPIEIVVGDDYSSDSTLEVARAYEQKHPGVVRVIARERNIGIQRNYYDTFENCRGKYIAWLDADDYWTDPEKLTLQAGAMEADPTITLCGHYIRVVTTDGVLKQERSPSTPPGRYGAEAVLRSCFLPSLSGVFRNGIQRRLPAWYFDLAPVTEWPIWVLAALAGDVVMIDRVMADYTHTPGSAAASKGPLFRARMEAKFYDCIQSVLPARLQRIARAEQGKRYEAIAYHLRTTGDCRASRQAAAQAFGAPFFADNLYSKTRALLMSLVREALWRIRGPKQQAET